MNRKRKIVKGSGGRAKPKTVETSVSLVAGAEAVVNVETSVEVFLQEADALVEVQCKDKEGLMLDILLSLANLRIDVMLIQSTAEDGIFVAELKLKVEDNVGGERISSVDLKNLITRIINEPSISH
ncbi:transcription factor BHLH42-like [Mercurialis annua]|uniref:transcription factor BHLH42-like n=1 Tax=Mercurialis annua TaxID=3986 RepID=UPI0021604D7B|nr:transcription factor BHLH42-like [Mercurialis annua]